MIFIAHESVEFCEATPIGLDDGPKKCCTGARRTETCVAPRDVNASRDFSFTFSEQAAWGGGGGCQTMTFLLLLFFPVQQTTSGIDHRVKKFFRVGNQYAECEDIFFPLTEGCSEGLDAFRFFKQQQQLTQILPPEGETDNR